MKECGGERELMLILPDSVGRLGVEVTLRRW